MKTNGVMNLNATCLSQYVSQRLRKYACIAGALLSGPVAMAQTASDTQSSIEQQRRAQEQERTLREQQERRPSVHTQPQVQPPTSSSSKTAARLVGNPAESTCFTIEKIVFQTDRAEDLDAFRWLPAYAHVADPNRAATATDNADSPVGQCIGANGINTLLTRLQNALVAKGFTTSRVLTGPQDLRTGTLTLQLIIGRIGKINYSSNAQSSLLNPGKAPLPSLATALAMAEGDVLNLRDIEMTLENFKRVPTADADIKIEASLDSGQPGLSDLTIVQQQQTPYRASLGFNDSGSSGTGKYMASATLSLDQLFWANDLFYVSLNQEALNTALGGKDPLPRSTLGYVLHYSLPIGYASLETTHSKNSYYQTVAGASRQYVYSGVSFNQEIKASALLYRDAVAKLSASYKLWQKRSSNFIDDAEIDVQRRATTGYDLGVNYRTLLSPATQSSVETSWTYREGTRALGALPAPEELFDEGTARPRLFLADASLNVPFQVEQQQGGKQQFKYSANWRAQWHRTKLLASDRFAIGGRYTVRGFDSTLAAERGFVIRQDLGWMLPGTQTELYLGIDHGQVSGESAPDLAGTSLTGMALGLRGKWAQDDALSFDVFWAQPLKKPSNFRAAGQTAGFSAILNF